ncbi:MAG TPA: glycosyltransferase [Halanaerobiales bacterium]|nr:glycosyltransferase [Halanaerobiales bacterium]
MDISEINNVAFLNPQGNFDPNDSYWTEHPDFGGQLVYVKEVSLALAKLGINVDIITRQIKDKDWPEFSKPIDKYPQNDKVRIVRIPFGGDDFLRKEKLWPYIDDYVEGIIDFYEEQGNFPDFITTHYADGGLSGLLLKDKKGLPFTFTGHSLGAQKMDKLDVNKINFTEYNTKFNFHRRIIAERLSMNHADGIVVSTSQERFEQYSHDLYKDAVDPENDNKFKVIPPGVNTDIFNSEYTDKIKNKLEHYINRDINEERKDLPLIISSSRLDQKKNHLGLVKAFAENKKLQKKANLAIALRGIENPFEDYSNADKEEKNILDQIMKIIYNNNCSGKVTMFSLNSQKQLAETYAYFASKKSVFALTSFYEPFGLAPVEAMASGLPAVVTENGGPVEIMNKGEFGVLVDPEEPEDIADGLLEILSDEKNWQHYHKKGKQRVMDKYTWEQTAKAYLEFMKEILNSKKEEKEKLDVPDYFTEPDTKNDSRLLDRFLRIWKK